MIFVAAALLLVGNALVQHPATTLISFGVTLLGWPVYLLWFRSGARARNDSSGSMESQ